MFGKPPDDQLFYITTQARRKGKRMRDTTKGELDKYSNMTVRKKSIDHTAGSVSLKSNEHLVSRASGH